jgi:hypothetical protein
MSISKKGSPPGEVGLVASAVVFLVAKRARLWTTHPWPARECLRWGMVARLGSTHSKSLFLFAPLFLFCCWERRHEAVCELVDGWISEEWWMGDGGVGYCLWSVLAMMGNLIYR